MKKKGAVKADMLPCPLCISEDLRIETYGIECRSCGLWLGDGTQVQRHGGFKKLWNRKKEAKP